MARLWEDGCGSARFARARVFFRCRVRPFLAIYHSAQHRYRTGTRRIYGVPLVYPEYMFGVSISMAEKGIRSSEVHSPRA